MTEWELLESDAKPYRAEVFTHLFSLQTKRALRYQELFSIFLIGLDQLSTSPSESSELMELLLNNLRPELRGTDLIGQMGNEISILLLHAGEEELPTIADRIQKRIENFSFPSHLVTPLPRVTISIGAACFPGSGNSDTLLLTNARLSLDEAKRRGGNCLAVRREN